jgi:ferrous iron transport protein B
MAVADNLLDPLGLNIGDVSDMQSAATDQEVSHGTFGEMQARFDGQAGAFAYLVAQHRLRQAEYIKHPKYQPQLL